MVGSVTESSGATPTVISKIGPDRVRSSTAPLTSPMTEAISPG